jgi:hypothetical protein
MLLISFSFNQVVTFCISTHASVLINQYSTGLFVSHSIHGKAKLHEKYFKLYMEAIYECS